MRRNGIVGAGAIAGCATLGVAAFGLKLALIQPVVPNSEPVLTRQITQMLRRSGFATAVHREPEEVDVVGRRGACRVWIADLDPDGAQLAFYRLQSRAYGPLRFAYRGALGAEPPGLGAFLAVKLPRAASRIGIAIPRQPVLAVAAGPACSLDRIDWRDLATART